MWFVAPPYYKRPGDKHIKMTNRTKSKNSGILQLSYNFQEVGTAYPNYPQRKCILEFPLAKKRWNVFITCQQKMAYLSGTTRVSTKKYITKYSFYKYHVYLGYKLHSSVCSQALHENILSVYFKFPLVKKRWNIFITCQQKMAHLSGTRVWTKKYIMYIYIYRITATFPAWSQALLWEYFLCIL